MKFFWCLTLTIVTHSLHAQQPAEYVNPFIGTGGHGHTFPAATTPFGMVQVGPDTRVDGSWDGCSGYHYSDSIIYGFSHTHLSGTGVSDFGDIMLMPVQGKPVFNRDMYASKFLKTNEKASAGYYGVTLERHGIQAEMTASQRVGLHKYTFAKPGPVAIMLDLEHRDALTEFEIKVISKTRIEGFRRSSGWASDQVVYFVIEFSQPFLKAKFDAKKSKAGFIFLLKNKNPIFAKVAISYTGAAGAAANLEKEIPTWNFEHYRNEALLAWNQELSKIEAGSSNKQELVKFYTSLYHCMIHPSIATDVTGEYRGMDSKIHKAEGYTHYHVFSLWDTYRALHPLLTIIDRKRTLDFIQTFLSMYKEGGRLPIWELAANETDCMIGYHCVSVIADAWAKGIRGFDSALALKAMVSIAKENKYGKNFYIKNGYISSEQESESVSKTLEYAYDDWCISQFAQSIGALKEAAEFAERSNYWFHLFDPYSGFIRPRFNGNWLEPFDAREVNNHYTEANCWQYNFCVQQNIRGLMQALGGPEALGNKLDKLFSEKSKPTGREQADITGLIGQYAQGNEPSHHMAYLYNYIYMPERTQHLIHSICRDFYTTEPNGLIGNEDCGQMSAWYVLSALGLYQVTPGHPVFTIGTPALDQAILHLENGNKFTINTKNRTSATAFNLPVFQKENTMFLQYGDLQSGGEITYQMEELPSEKLLDYFLPELPGHIVENPAPPLIHAPRSFKGTATATIQSVGPSNRVYYYLDNDSLNPVFYSKPIVLDKSVTIHAFVVKEIGVETMKSPLSVARCYKRDNTWNIEVLSKPNSQYTAGGNEALLDGIRGTANWRAGDWQGYQSQDFEAIIDMGNAQLVSQVECGFLQDSRAWILMPKKVEIYWSVDGKEFTLASSVSNKIAPEITDIKIQDLVAKIPNPKKCRYLKIKAYNYGRLPSWHAGYTMNGEAFIFVDEIRLK